MKDDLVQTDVQQVETLSGHLGSAITDTKDDQHITRRAPHMERWVEVKRCYPSDEHPDGHFVRLHVGNQRFTISSGDGEIFESQESAEWTRDMICIALDSLVKIAVDDPDLMGQITRSDFLRASAQHSIEERSDTAPPLVKTLA